MLLDAFGMRFVERHADHPLLRRLRISPLRSQFPSTTTAHVTTMHTGAPVGAHGLYEWNVYEPALDAVITPILYAAAGSYEPDGLRGSGVAMADIVPPGTIYERLAEAGVPSVVLQPSAFSPSTYDSVALRGAELRPFDTIEDGAAGLAAALERPGYAYLYWHEIDMTGHLRGPDSPEFDAACVRALDALEAALAAAGPEALVLFTADHGQVAVDPSRVDYLEDFLPEVDRYLAHGPAGSARDLFLHAQPGLAADLAGELRERMAGRAEVVLVAELEAARPVRGGRPAAARAARGRLRAARRGPDGVAALGRQRRAALPRPPRRAGPGGVRDVARGYGARMSLRGGIDLGGTKIQAVVVDEDFQVLGDARVPTPTEGGPQDVADAMAEAMRQAADGHGDPVAIGVGSPGVIDDAAGRRLQRAQPARLGGQLPAGGRAAARARRAGGDRQRRQRRHRRGVRARRGARVRVAARRLLGHRRRRRDHPRLQALVRAAAPRGRSATSSSRSAARAARAAGAAAWRPTPAAARWRRGRASSPTRAARPCCSRSWRSAAGRG